MLVVLWFSNDAIEEFYEWLYCVVPQQREKSPEVLGRIRADLAREILEFLGGV